MRTLSQIVLVLLSSSIVLAQSVSHHPSAALKPQSEKLLRLKQPNRRPTSMLPQAAQLLIPGAVDVGITGKWYLQTQSQGLHNVQVDPSNQNNIHLCVMSAFNVTADDTLAESYYPNRRVYYVFSSDGGTTWTQPKAISNLRTGYPAMILIQRDGKYIPVIAAHRNVSETETDVLTCLFIETGNPGAGNFVTVEGSRETYLDNLRDIIWPSVALSNDGTKVFVIASAFNTPFDYLQFGWFSLTSDKKNATFSGWKPGPAANDDRALANGGSYCIRVSPSGKVGVVWQNYDFSIPDLGLYYCESTDDGNTWGTPNNIFYAHPSSSDGYSLVPADGLDLMFDGEEPVVAFTGYLSDMLDAGGSYIPASGSLLFWRQGYTDAKLLVFKVGDGTVIDELEPLFDAAWLSGWLNSDPVDPGGPNLKHCTIGVGSDPKSMTLFFEVWVQDDTGEIGEFPSDPSRSAAPFGSIWQISTTDGGQTWATPEAVFANDLSTSTRIDYRYPSVSTFNPVSGGNVQYNLAFSADDAPGNNAGRGENNFSDVSIFFTNYAQKVAAGLEMPAEVDFGAQRVQNSTDSTFNIRNTSNATVNIASFALTGQQGAFAITDSTAHSIAANGSISVTVRYTPDSATQHSASLVIKTTESPQKSYTIELRGRGIAPNLIVPSEIIFGDQKLQETRDTTITLYNTGSASLTVASFVLTGATGVFSITDSTDHGIAAGDSVTLTIRNAPQTEESFAATVTITTLETPQQIRTIDLSTRGVNSNITVSQPIIDFGGLDTGKTLSEDIVITNTGTTSLLINAIQLSGAGLDQFAISNLTLPFTLNQGEGTTLAIRFAPQKVGTHDAVLEISPSEGSTLNVLLHGVGTAVQSSVPRQKNLIALTLVPNPTRSVLTANFALKTDERITIRVFTIDGKLVRSMSEQFTAGQREWRIDCSAFPAGEYFIRIAGTAGILAESKFLILQ